MSSLAFVTLVTSPVVMLSWPTPQILLVRRGVWTLYIPAHRPTLSIGSVAQRKIVMMLQRSRILATPAHQRFIMNLRPFSLRLSVRRSASDNNGSEVINRLKAFVLIWSISLPLLHSGQQGGIQTSVSTRACSYLGSKGARTTDAGEGELWASLG